MTELPLTRWTAAPLTVWRVLLMGLLLMLGSASTQARQLVVTVQPLYLIAQAVTAGIETPTLLLPAGQDGHHIQLSPRQAQSLRQADLIVWIGPSLEGALTRHLQGQPNQLALSSLSALRRLPLRDVQGQAIHGSLDPHLWLDPINAIGMAHAMAALRGLQYPADAARYRANAQRFGQQMLAVMLQSRPRHTRPYWAWHDAYQYLEAAQRLQLRGALTADPELSPSLSRLQQASQTPTPTCLLSGQPVPDSLLRRLPRLRPLRVDENLGQAASFVQGWQQLTQQLQGCP